MASTLPSPEVRANITEKLSELVKAIESHPAWVPPNPHKGLFHVWDFVNRSRYIMTELDHIRDGQPVQYPEQLPQQRSGRSGPAAAAEYFSDVRGRVFTVNEMIKGPKLMTMMGLPQIDYGSDINAKSQAAVEAFDLVR
ncbi:hypothetical protein CCHL11_05514 [Colletotrichum chlorophyti]|uniref:Uncharacterized protein n=1 Tax=Colletotrichum chlorophyti TaxID=708187 RepID=A0A1Q8RBS0_9PEZI|nr:hypothetical protein CCHL11_05514 [Colletotrichum chlorophyti]